MNRRHFLSLLPASLLAQNCCRSLEAAPAKPEMPAYRPVCFQISFRDVIPAGQPWKDLPLPPGFKIENWLLTCEAYHHCWLDWTPVSVRVYREDLRGDCRFELALMEGQEL